jgi:hypothetical protein
LGTRVVGPDLEPQFGDTSSGETTLEFSHDLATQPTALLTWVNDTPLHSASMAVVSAHHRANDAAVALGKYEQVAIVFEFGHDLAAVHLGVVLDTTQTPQGQNGVDIIDSYVPKRGDAGHLPVLSHMGLDGRQIVRQHVEALLTVEQVSNSTRERWSLTAPLLDGIGKLRWMRRRQTHHW